jgi:hypothetical protein
MRDKTSWGRVRDPPLLHTLQPASAGSSSFQQGGDLTKKPCAGRIILGLVSRSAGLTGIHSNRDLTGTPLKDNL